MNDPRLRAEHNNGPAGRRKDKEKNSLRSSLGLTEQNVFMHYESIVMIRSIDHDNTLLYRCIFFPIFFFQT